MVNLQLDYAQFLSKTGRKADARVQAQLAVQRVEKVLDESPRDVWALMLWTRGTVALGTLAEATGDPTTALDCYNRAAEQWLPMAEKYQDLLMGREAARILLSRRAALYEQQGKPDLAAADRAQHNRICPP